VLVEPGQHGLSVTPTRHGESNVERLTAVRMVARTCSRVRTHGRGRHCGVGPSALKPTARRRAALNESTVTSPVTDFSESAGIGHCLPRLVPAASLGPASLGLLLASSLGPAFLGLPPLPPSALPPSASSPAASLRCVCALDEDSLEQQ
jgi:hypothetical protein